MATTAMQVFSLAMQLMGEGNETTGATDTADNLEYKNRTLPIINILQQECYPISDTYTVSASGTRPILPYLTSPTSELGLDDALCSSALPYGLAAHLLLSEGRSTEASFFNQRYEEAKDRFKAIPSEFESIEQIYGGFDVGSYDAAE